MTYRTWRWRVHSGQIVVAQVALVAIIATSGDPIMLVGGVVLLTTTFLPVRGRWLGRWLPATVRRLTGRHTAPADADVVTVLARARPGTRLADTPLLGYPAAILVDPYGITALIEVDVAEHGPDQVRSLHCRSVPAAATTVLVSAAPTGQSTNAASQSYSELMDGRPVAIQVLMAVRVAGDRAGTAPERLASAVQALQRSLAPLPSKVLESPAARLALAELGLRAPLREHWTWVGTAGLRQVTYRVTCRRLPIDLTELLALPATACTVAVAGDQLTIRLTDPLPRAEAALLRMLSADPWLQPLRLDGAHLPALAAGLPQWHTPDQDEISLQLPAAGLMIGRGPDHLPVLVRMLGTPPTRVALIGGYDVAALLVWRALGAGAQVVVHTAQPALWSGLARAALGCPLRIVTGDRLALDHTAPGHTGPHRMVLQVIEADAAAPEPPDGQPAAIMHHAPNVTKATLNVLAGADVVLTAPLEDSAATLVGATLGLGAAGAALQHGAFGKRHKTAAPTLATIFRKAIRWAHTSPTTTEWHLLNDAAGSMRPDHDGPTTGA